MVVIRLVRHGAKKSPFYHMSVTDRRARRDGRFIERVGFYNPVARGHSERFRLNLERIEYWQSVGAHVTPKAEQIIKEARILKLKAAETIDESVDIEDPSEVNSDLSAEPTLADEPSTSNQNDQSVDLTKSSSLTETSAKDPQ